jgi:hypothetical protein
MLKNLVYLENIIRTHTKYVAIVQKENFIKSIMRKKEKKQENILLAPWGLFRQKGN